MSGERPLLWHRSGCVTINCRGCGSDWASVDYSTPPLPTACYGDFSIGGDLWPGLSKLIEESGEVAMLLPELILAKLLARIQQLSGKLMQCPDGNHWSGDLLKAFTEETGDLYAALDFFVGSNADLDMAAVNNRRAEKFARFSKWHRENLAANQ